MNKDILKKIINQKSTIVFIVIATMFWFNNKLNKRYTADIEIQIKIANDYKSPFWIQNSDISYFINCEADGRLLIMARMGILPAFKINSSSLRFIHKQGYENVVDPNSLRIALQQRSNKINVNYIIDSQKKITISKLTTKKVKIKPNLDITCARQYMIVGQTKFSFDSVEVKAPQILLDTIKAINTAWFVKNNAKTNVRSALDLLIPENVLCQQKEIIFETNIVQYTEMEMELPINIRSAKDDKTAFVIPTTTNIRVRVPLDTYNGKSTPIAYIDLKNKRSSSLFQVGIDSLPYGALLVKVDPQFVEPFVQ